MRTFETGATRDSDPSKLDYEGFLSPLVLKRFAEYMHKNQETAAGLRASDNWQNGIPKNHYMKSLLRHVMELWHEHRMVEGADKEEALCGVIFNAMGYLFEELLEREFHAEDMP